MNNKILLCEQYWKKKPKLSMLKRQKGFDNISFFDIHDANHYLVADKFMSKEKIESFTKPYTVEDVLRITDEEFRRLRPLKSKLTVYRGIRKPDEENGVLYNRFQQAINLKKGDVFYMPEYAFTVDGIEIAETYTGVNNKGILFEIELPKGTKTNRDSSYHILSRASKFECLSNEETDEYHLIKIKLIDNKNKSFINKIKDLFKKK